MAEDSDAESDEAANELVAEESDSGLVTSEARMHRYCWIILFRGKKRSIIVTLFININV